MRKLDLTMEPERSTSCSIPMGWRISSTRKEEDFSRGASHAAAQAPWRRNSPQAIADACFADLDEFRDGTRHHRRSDGGGGEGLRVKPLAYRDRTLSMRRRGAGAYRGEGRHAVLRLFGCNDSGEFPRL